MSEMRDTQRSKLYRAEGVATGKSFADIAEVRAYVEKINRSAWWRSHHKFPGIPIEVTDGRGRRKACALGMRTIKLPKWARYEEVVLHELAHTIITSRFGYGGAPAHGREFAKMLLLMVRHFMGKDDYETLKTSFKIAGVKYATSKV
jgi:putative metallohydrolase (TIGR04338 family)